MGQLKEECGVFGIYGSKCEDVAQLTYYGLFALQHRGQEACGIVVNDDGLFNFYKDTGLVNDETVIWRSDTFVMQLREQRTEQTLSLSL